MSKTSKKRPVSSDLREAKRTILHFELRYRLQILIFPMKNLHDDAPDSLAMLADYLSGGIKSVSVAKRPF